MNRVRSLNFRGTDLLLPNFFPSISSVKTNLSPADYLQVLLESEFPQFLVSAYDAARADDVDKVGIEKHVAEAIHKGSVVLMDSGNYESFWHRDRTWTMDAFHATCARMDPSFAFSFDDQDPPDNVERAAEIVIERTGASMQALPNTPFVPIVHASSHRLTDTVVIVVRELRCKLVAVAERELGDGLRARTRKIREIRTALDDNGLDCAIHVLGTGHPFTVTALALSGADSFDGLEWCQTSVDYSTGQLGHFQHWDLYSATSPLRDIRDLPYIQKVLAHNLVFYAELMHSLREYMQSGRATPLVDSIVSLVADVIRAPE